MKNLFTEAMIPFWIALGSLATTVAVVIALLSWLRPRSQTAKHEKVPRMVVRRVLRDNDEDLTAAYEVYRRGITNARERDSFADIQRWLREAEEERETGTAKLDEYLLIEKIGTKVCGFFYGQYYPGHRMFLVGYLVIDHGSLDARRERSVRVIEHLRNLLKVDHPECAGVCFEIALDSRKDSRVRTGKEELFGVHALTAGKVVLKRLDIEYRQPKLSLWDPSRTEERQHLIYGRISGPPLAHFVDKVEAEQVLDVVYNYWYGDYYLDDPSKDAEYRRYVRGMYEATVSSLPAQVALI